MSLLDLRIAFVSQLKQNEKEGKKNTFCPLSDNEIKAYKE